MFMTTVIRFWCLNPSNVVYNKNLIIITVMVAILYTSTGVCVRVTRKLICLYLCCTYIFIALIIIHMYVSSPPSSFFLCHSFSPDASLTLRRVYQVTSAVAYSDLNYCLDVPLSVYWQINANPAYPTEKKKREAQIAYFLHSLPLASWATLAGRLYYREQHSSLEAAREYLQHTTG